MNKRGKILILGLSFIISFIVVIICFKVKLISYAIIGSVVCLVLLFVLMTCFVNSRSDDSVYKSELNRILKTYDAVLVKCSSLPSLEGRNIINVETINDLVNAQVEIRKPIYYKLQLSCCSFLLLDDKEACTFVLKLNNEVVSELEILLEEEKIKRNKVDEDYSILDDIDKTTIIKLENSKSYRVSPIRKKTIEIENLELEKTEVFEDFDDIEELI